MFGRREPVLTTQSPPTPSPVTLSIANMLYKLLAVVALAATYASAETHVVTFDNRSVVAFADSKGPG